MRWSNPSWQAASRSTSSEHLHLHGNSLLACIKQPISGSYSEPNRTTPNPFSLFLRPSILMLSFSSSIAHQPLLVQVLLDIEASRSHSDTPHSVELLWTSDQAVARLLPDNTQLSEEKYPYLWRDSNLQKSRTHFICAMHSKFPAHFMLCYFPILIIFSEGCKLSKYSYEFPALAYYSDK